MDGEPAAVIGAASMPSARTHLSMEEAAGAFAGPAWYGTSWDVPWRDVAAAEPVWAHDVRALFRAIEGQRAALVADRPPHARWLSEVHVVGYGVEGEGWVEHVYASGAEAAEAYVEYGVGLIRRRRLRGPLRARADAITITHYSWDGGELLYLPTDGETRSWAPGRGELLLPVMPVTVPRGSHEGTHRWVHES